MQHQDIMGFFFLTFVTQWPDELEDSTAVQWKVKRHTEEDAQNFLEVFIERSVHLPLIEGVQIPSAFVSLQWINSGDHGDR